MPKIANLRLVKRLLIFLALSLFLFNWIGYQLYTTIASQSSIATEEKEGAVPAPVTGKMSTIHLSLYAKELDFDDLLEFTSGKNYSVNEIYFTMSNDLFPDRACKQSQCVSFKCFNGEYYSGSDQLFSKYADAYSSGKEPDRYLLKIATVFLPPQEHPPQFVG